MLLRGKPHFHVLSGSALIGANLINIEDDVEIDSLIAWCVETIEVGSHFPLKHILAD